jgi:cytoskeletal protein RodZ
LQAARRERSVSLEQIARETHISLCHLQSLEAGKLQDLPGGMYNRAILRSYCNYLGLEAGEYLARYEEERPTPQERSSRAAVAGIEMPSRSYRVSPILVWSGMLLGSIAGLYFSRGWIEAVFSPYFSNSPAAVLPSPQPATPPAAVPDFDAGPVSQPETGKVTETVDSLPLGVAAPTGESAGDAIRLRLHAIQECWISVVSDGRRVAQRTLFPGDVLSLRANERFDVVLGNAGGIGLEINGKPAKTLGKPGEVVRFEITPQSVTSLLEKGLG